MGGLNLDGRSSQLAPGIYYEGADGKWVACGTDQTRQDTALVFYIYRESQGRLEMVLAGFSGRATRMLARLLGIRAQEFWPPVYMEQGIQIGAYVVHFTQPDEPGDFSDVLRTDFAVNSLVTPLPKESIARRLVV